MRRRPLVPAFGLVRALVPALAALAATACGRDDASLYFGTVERHGKDASTFYVNNGSEPEYLDPGKCSDGGSSALVLQLFEGLTAYDPRDMHPVQGVATHWEQSADNRLFRFHLRDDAKWSDGKPVTAHDFAYAWKRVLRPATASRAVANLYSLKNGELFSNAKLLALREASSLRAEPDDGAPTGVALGKGTIVRVLGKSPMKVSTAIAPLAEPPVGVKLVSYLKADERKKTPEQLSFGDARPPAGPDTASEWKGADVRVLAAGPPVDCDGAADVWFLLEKAGKRGYLPGCLLSEAASARTFVLVERYDRPPTYAVAVESAPALGAPARGFLDEKSLVEDDTVVGVRATDDRTLEVELEQPTPYFTDLTSYPTLFPVRRDVIEAFEQRGEPDLWTRPGSIVSNGPYVLDEWKFRYEITMRANPEYWNAGKLAIRRIVWLEVEDYHATMNLYKAGDIDYIGDNISPPSEYLSLLSTKKDFRSAPYLSVYWFELNTRKPPLNDVRVRRALNLAVDKRQIVEKVARGGQLPATHYVPDFTGLGYADKAAEDKRAGADPFAGPGMEFDPERARALMKEAGHEVVREGDGRRAPGFPPIEILYNTSEGHKQIAVALQDMWKKHLGISATLRNEEWKVMLKEYRDGHFQVMRFGWTADYNHPQTFLEQFLSGNPQNQTGWGDAAFDDTLRRAARTPDSRASIELYRAAEGMAVAAMPRIPIYFYTKSGLLKPWVKGFWPSARNSHLVQYFSIDPRWAEHPENVPAYPPPEFPKPRILEAGP